MLQESEIRILSAFFPDVRRLRTTGEIRERSGYSHERVFTILKKLAEEGHVSRERFGNVNVYKLRLSWEHFRAFLYYNEKLLEKNRKNISDEKISALLETEGIVNILLIDEGGRIKTVSARRDDMKGENNKKELSLNQVFSDKKTLEKIISGGIVLSEREYYFRHILMVIYNGK